MSGQPDPKGEPRIVDRTATKRTLLRYRSCLACGGEAANGHHVIGVGRGKNGDDVIANIVSLCGTGSSGCHGAFHGNSYSVHTGVEEIRSGSPARTVGQVPSLRERRDREWVARRIGERLLEQRPDVVEYVLGKLGDVAGRDFLERTYHVGFPAAMMPQ